MLTCTMLHYTTGRGTGGATFILHLTAKGTVKSGVEINAEAGGFDTASVPPQKLPHPYWHFVNERYKAIDGGTTTIPSPPNATWGLRYHHHQWSSSESVAKLYSAA